MCSCYKGFKCKKHFFFDGAEKMCSNKVTFIQYILHIYWEIRIVGITVDTEEPSIDDADPEDNTEEGLYCKKHPGNHNRACGDGDNRRFCGCRRGRKCGEGQLYDPKTKTCSSMDTETLLFISEKCKNRTPDQTPPPEDTTPAISEDTTPSVSEDTTPAVSEDTTPSVSEDTTPAVSEDTTPAVSEDTTPATSEPGETTGLPLEQCGCTTEETCDKEDGNSECDDEDNPGQKRMCSCYNTRSL
jgi:hypothetical protein